MTLYVRPSQDCEALSRLHAACFDRAWTPGDFRALLARNGAFALIAAADETDVGFVLAGCVADESEVLSIGVLPGWRKQGAGRALIGQAICRARENGAGKMILEVAEDNEVALSLYRRTGFVAAGRRENYYEPRRSERPKSALVMTLDLRS